MSCLVELCERSVSCLVEYWSVWIDDLDLDLSFLLRFRCYFISLLFFRCSVFRCYLFRCCSFVVPFFVVIHFAVVDSVVVYFVVFVFVLIYFRYFRFRCSRWIGGGYIGDDLFEVLGCVTEFAFLDPDLDVVKLLSYDV